MDRHFDQSLREVKDQLLAMGGLVEHAIENAIGALQQGDKSKLAQVFETEAKINQAHIAVDDTCLKLLALQQPLAADLRLIVAIIKINTDLERMGDQAVNIAHNAERYMKDKPLKPLVDLPMMCDEARLMVREALDSFVRRDEAMAKSVFEREKRVDAFKSKIFVDVLEHLRNNADKIEQGLALILIARNVERIGDHSTNIAEDVIFVISGKDIRHSGSSG